MQGEFNENQKNLFIRRAFGIFRSVCVCRKIIDFAGK
jgi:hypothetical protein